MRSINLIKPEIYNLKPDVSMVLYRFDSDIKNITS